MRRNSQSKFELHGISNDLGQRIKRTANNSWHRFGKNITFYLPGMFTIDGKRGRYPVVSVTGTECELQCKHCKGKLLESMYPARNADELILLARKLKNDGIDGILLSGGSTRDGFVPLIPVLSAVPKLKEMGFYVSAHSGFATPQLAKAIADSGIDQVLIDVIGDDNTMEDVLNLSGGTEIVKASLKALFDAGLSVVPHIIIGLGGEIRGEYRAMKMLCEYPIEILCYVVLMPNVAMGRKTKPVSVDSVMDVIVSGMELFPDIEHSLGCARPRGAYRYELEKRVLHAGINRMALWSDEAIAEARKLGLNISIKYTCCSVSP